MNVVDTEFELIDAVFTERAINQLLESRHGLNAL